MKRVLHRLLAAAAALVLTAGLLSPAVYGLRVYDKTAQDYPSFSAAARTAQTESTLIVKTDGTLPDFRTLHPDSTVKGPDDTYTVTFSDALEAAAKLPRINEMRGVEYAEPNRFVRAQGDGEALIEYLSYGMELMHADTFVKQLCAREEALQPVVVAVVDSGVQADVPIFKDRLVEGATMIESPQTQDNYGHGTAVAGVLADCTQGLPVQIMPVRVLRADGTGTLLEAANGAKYAADHGAAIVNLSFVAEVCSRTLHDAVDHVLRQGALPVISAGNYALDLDKKECCPADYAPGIVVSGCDRNTEFYSGSCFGSTVDLCAPAVGVKCVRNHGEPLELNGTSFAAPHISAIAALYKLYMPDADCAALERMLTLNTRDLGDAGFDPQFGYGLPDLSALDGTQQPLPRTVTDVQILRAPNKTTYYYKEPFSADGLLLQVTYSDGTTETRSTQGVRLLGTDDLTRGSHTIRAVYDGHEATFDVTVKYRWWQWLVKILLFGWIWY